MKAKECEKPEDLLSPPALVRCEFHQTLRDEFAKAALQGIITSNRFVKDANATSTEMAASDAYRFADAMIVQREKRR